MGHLGARLSRPPAGAILAGGRATRLGGAAKGLLEVGGRRMIDRVADALVPLTSELLVVTNEAGAGSWLRPARVVADVLSGGGSAAGVHAAIVAAEGPVLVVGWDLPFVDEHVLALLLGEGDASAVDAVVPSGPAGDTYEPLCAWYAPAAADAIARAWTANARSLHGVLRQIRTRVIPASRFAPFGETDRLFLNVNTPEDLARARRAAGSGGGDAAGVAG